MGVFLAIKAGRTPPPEFWRFTICERMGWTLGYYDNLLISEINDLLAVWDGESKAQDSARRVAEFKQAAKAG